MPNKVTIRFATRRLLIGVAIVALMIASVSYAIHAYNSAFRSLEEFSAIWLTHDMLANYMGETDGEWPDNWGDLEPAFVSINRQAYGVPDLDWVRDRISIDFGVDLAKIAASRDGRDDQLHAVRMTSGVENGETRSANARLMSAILKWSSHEAETQNGT